LAASSLQTVLYSDNLVIIVIVLYLSNVPIMLSSSNTWNFVLIIQKKKKNLTGILFADQLYFII